MSRSRSRLVVAFVAALLVLSACGSSTTVGQANDVTASAALPVETDSSPIEEAAAEPVVPATVAATGTLTLGSGEVYELSVRSCETQATDPNSLVNDDYVDISADTADGYRFILLNARTAESPPAKAQVGLTGERDENGVNPDVDYVNLGSGDDPTLTPLVVNGTQVSGEALLDGKFSRNKPFGDTVTASFVFNCG